MSPTCYPTPDCICLHQRADELPTEACSSSSTELQPWGRDVKEDIPVRAKKNFFKKPVIEEAAHKGKRMILEYVWQVTQNRRLDARKERKRGRDVERGKFPLSLVAQGHFPFRLLERKCLLPWDLMDVSFWDDIVGAIWEWTHAKSLLQ